MNKRARSGKTAPGATALRLILARQGRDTPILEVTLDALDTLTRVLVMADVKV